MNINKLNNKRIKQDKYFSFQWLKELFLIMLIVQLSLSMSFAISGNVVEGKVSQNLSNIGKRLRSSPLLQLAGDTVVTRHFPGLNGGHVDGSVRVLLGESGNILTGTFLTGNLFVPGTPNINASTSSFYNGTLVGLGNSSPSGYTININTNATLNHIITRTDPISIPSLTSPGRPRTGINLTLNPGQLVTDFSGVQNITLNSNYGQLVVPPGSYGNFTALPGSGFTLGVNGQNTTYNLQGLVLNSSTQLQIRGNVTINLADVIGIGTNSVVGDPNNPVALLLKTTATNIIINSNASVYSVIQAPLSTFNISSGALLKGSLVCDKLNLNGGTIQNLIADTSPPLLTISQPMEGQIVNDSSVVVSGTFQDDSVVTIDANGFLAATSQDTYTVTVPLSDGNNAILVRISDIAGNIATLSVNVIKGLANNLPPIVNAGNDASITLPTNSINLNGSVSDDGLPSPPSQTTIAWTKVSGPANGTVIFSSPNTATTAATFNIAGTYILQLQASDTSLSASDTVTITVNQTQQQNQPPVVSAGNDLTITFPNNATLNGSVTDDGLPQGSSLSISWTQVGGKGIVTFSNPSTAITTASFSRVGIYVLRLTVTDGLLTSSDDVTIIVN